MTFPATPSLIMEIISISLSSSFVELSTTYIMRSASFANLLDLSTPSFSTISSVCLIPAVSMSFSMIPWMFICSSRVSLVVPAMSVTMALSSPNKVFRRLDFPAFGLPSITVFTPSVNILPLSTLVNNLSTAFIHLST